MKLLDKRTVNNLQNEQKRLEINEAIKLAGKVDRLRQVAATEQANLKKFKEEGVKVLKEELTHLKSQYNAIKQEVNALEEQRKFLMLPLNKEWAELRSEKDEFHIQVARLKELEVYLHRKEVDLDQKSREIDKYQAELQTLEEHHKSLLEDAIQKKKEAKQFYELKVKEVQKLDKEVIANRKLIKKEQEDLTFIKIDLDNREKVLNKREKVLNFKERQIKDQYETLQRTLTRLQNDKRSIKKR